MVPSWFLSNMSKAALKAASSSGRSLSAMMLFPNEECWLPVVPPPELTAAATLLSAVIKISMWCQIPVFSDTYNTFTTHNTYNVFERNCMSGSIKSTCTVVQKRYKNYVGYHKGPTKTPVIYSFFRPLVLSKCILCQ